MRHASMRFYFDSQNDQFSVHDEEGIELAGIEEAQSHAVSAMGGILRDLAGKETSGTLVISVRTEANPEPVIRSSLSFQISRLAPT